MREPGLTPTQRFLKRAIDFLVAIPGLILTLPIVAVAVVIATLDTREWGIYAQVRIGRYGRPFTLYKIRTMRTDPTLKSTSTSSADPRITRSGRVLRRFKIDELPQLYNVVRGDMGVVGPRPDVAGFADRLVGDDRVVLGIRPGITGPASLAFRHEEWLLASAQDPDTFNATVIWPAKVAINRRYVEQYRLVDDIRAIVATVSARSTMVTGAGEPEPVDLAEGG